jgi:hypothetical protein
MMIQRKVSHRIQAAQTLKVISSQQSAFSPGRSKSIADAAIKITWENREHLRLVTSLDLSAFRNFRPLPNAVALMLTAEC